MFLQSLEDREGVGEQEMIDQIQQVPGELTIYCICTINNQKAANLGLQPERKDMVSKYYLLVIKISKCAG